MAPFTPQRLANTDYSRSRPYFVTFCTKQRRRYFSNPDAAAGAVQAIVRHRDAGWYWLYAYCVMPDHIHIFFRTRGESRQLSRIVASIKAAIRRSFPAVRWQSGYYESIIRPWENPPDVAGYVLMNPVRAKLVNDFREYPFSGSLDRYC